jgi:hypothetical protein
VVGDTRRRAVQDDHNCSLELPEYPARMIEVASRTKGQDAPDWVLFEALTEPERDAARKWLFLTAGERRPEILEAQKPVLVVWSSLWDDRPGARIRFEITRWYAGSVLRWVLLVDEPTPDEATVREMRRRINTLINGNLRDTFGG